MAERGCGWIVVWRYEFDVLVIKAEIVDGFLDEIGILVADVTKLDSGDTHEQNSAVRVTVTGWFQPSVVRMPVYFLLERVEDSYPRIGRESCTWNRHKRSSRGRRLGRARLLKTSCEEFLFSAERHLIYRERLHGQKKISSKRSGGILAQNILSCGKVRRRFFRVTQIQNREEFSCQVANV